MQQGRGQETGSTHRGSEVLEKGPIDYDWTYLWLLLWRRLAKASARRRERREEGGLHDGQVFYWAFEQ